MKSLGFPLYMNGKLIPEPVTISHVPGPNESQGILKGIGVDPSMGALGAYALYSPTRGMRGFGDDAPAAVPINAEAQPPVAAAPITPLVPAPAPTISPGVAIVAGLIDLASTAGLAYHGYKRNKSIGWALMWAIFGGAVPIIGWPVAIAQGFGEPKAGLTPNRRRRRGMRRNGTRRRRRR